MVYNNLLIFLLFLNNTFYQKNMAYRLYSQHWPNQLYLVLVHLSISLLSFMNISFIRLTKINISSAEKINFACLVSNCFEIAPVLAIFYEKHILKLFLLSSCQ